MVLALAEATVFGAAAALSTLVGIWLAVASFRANRRSASDKAAKETHEQLIEARAEAERLSAELHKLRLERDAE